MFKCVLYDCMSQLLSDTATRNIIIQSHACVQLIDLVKSKIGEYADYDIHIPLCISHLICPFLLHHNIYCFETFCAVTPHHYIISLNLLIN